MNTLFNLIIQSLEQVWGTLQHNWPFLVISVLISVGLKLYMDPQKVAAFLTRYRRAGVLGATAAAVGTPLCSCGTTAVILGMIASTMPWAPIVAFMVASPLTSPEELIYSAGLFGWPFAIAFFAASILLGLLGGALAEVCESRGWLKNQARFAEQPVSIRANTSQVKPQEACACQPAAVPAQRLNLPRDIRASRPVLATSLTGGTAAALTLSSCCAPAEPACGCGNAEPAAVPASCGCGGEQVNESASLSTTKPADRSQTQPKVTLRDFLRESYSTGKRLLVMFVGFAFIGYFLNGLIPQAWVSAIFGPGNVYSVPLAASLGLPLYINTEGSLPLVRALIDGGMSQGAALAFLITGAGTSFGAIAGALTIARWRVIGLVVGTLWVGATIIGYLYNFLLASGLI